MPPRDPEYRRCPATGRWVILAPGRARRPLTLAHSEPHHRAPANPVGCPLCEGAEAGTPPEHYAVRRDGTPADGPGWSLRVVPNKFPAVHPIGEPHYPDEGEFFDSLPGFGEHELVIECPRHERTPAALTAGELAAVLAAYRARLRHFARNPVYAYCTVFKNVGAEAGASLEHTHSQIVATPIVPEAVRAELDWARGYHRRRGGCVYCDMVRAEREASARMIAEVPGFMAFAPFAPRFAHEVWVLPTAHAADFAEEADGALASLAELLKKLFAALDRVLDEPAFNYYLHTAPLRAGRLGFYHWHLELIPRTSRQAGFEWGSGCFINTALPEESAAALRGVLSQGVALG